MMSWRKGRQCPARRPGAMPSNTYDLVPAFLCVLQDISEAGALAEGYLATRRGTGQSSRVRSVAIDTPGQDLIRDRGVWLIRPWVWVDSFNGLS